MRKLLRKVAATSAAVVMAVAVIASAGSTASAKKDKKPSFDPAGTYHAYVGLQQSGTWIFHDECTSETLGLNGTDLNGLNYETDVMQNGDEGAVKVDGELKNAEITGNGTYQISMTGLNGILTADSTAAVTMIYISTDIPADAEGQITFSDIVFKIDNKTQTLPAEYFIKPETKDNGYYSVYLYDTYARDQGEYADCPSILTPSDSIEITFTISGMTNDNPDAVLATEEPAADSDAAATSDASDDDDDSEEESSGIGAPVVAGIVVAVVVVAGVVVVVTRKKK